MIARVLMFMFPGIKLGVSGENAECVIRKDNGGPYIAEWNRLDPQPTPAELAAAELPAVKAATIAANRAECSRRIYARYPAGRQLSALAGLYDSANVATMTDWIAANISAENTAADLIEAATTVQAVEAVTVAWPA